jgi:hypothetical protein
MRELDIQQGAEAAEGLIVLGVSGLAGVLGAEMAHRAGASIPRTLLAGLGSSVVGWVAANTVLDVMRTPGDDYTAVAV